MQVRLEYVEETLRDRRRFHALALLCSNSGASAEALTLWQVCLPVTSSFSTPVKHSCLHLGSGHSLAVLHLILCSSLTEFVHHAGHSRGRCKGGACGGRGSEAGAGRRQLPGRGRPPRHRAAAGRGPRVGGARAALPAVACLAPPPLTAWRCSRWGLCPHCFTFIRDTTFMDWQGCKM